MANEGSTTTAYGPATTNGDADLICRFFLESAIAGASFGRALLEARLRFVQEESPLSPVELKTLAQFCLYGDPSVHPVAKVDKAPAPKGVKKETVKRFRRNQRRKKLRETGEFLKATKPTASTRQKGGRMTAQAKTALAAYAAEGGVPRDQKFAADAVKNAKPAQRGATKAASAPSRYYLAIGRPRNDGRYRVVVIAKELHGRVVDHR